MFMDLINIFHLTSYILNHHEEVEKSILHFRKRLKNKYIKNIVDLESLGNK